MKTSYMKKIVAVLSVLLVSLSLQASDPDPFVFTVKTDNIGNSADNEFTVPTLSTSAYSYSINCGDSSATNGVSITGDYTCSYGSAGIYTISIYGTFPQIYFNNSGDKEKLLSVEQWGTGVWTSMQNAFYGANNLVLNAIDIPNLTNVSNMEKMFANCEVMNQNISDWNVAHVTNMKATFYGANTFNQDLSRWDVSNVTDMGSLFYNASQFNQDLSRWDVSNVTNMTLMFANAQNFNQPIGNWDVSNVKYMRSMFSGATVFDQDLGTWNFSNITSIGYYNILFATTLSLNHYDSLLNALATTAVKTDVSFKATTSAYCFGETARLNLVNDKNWTITDAGKNCEYYIDSPKIASVMENRTLVTTVTTTTLRPWLSSTYSIIDSGDGNLFNIDSATGELRFNVEPVYDTPIDSNQDNVYVVLVKAEDGVLSDVQTIMVSITPYVVSTDSFIMKIKTDNAGSSNNLQFTVPTDTTSVYNYDVDCNGDGVYEATAVTGDYTCNYNFYGVYTVIIDGEYPHIYFNSQKDYLKLLSVEQWGSSVWSSMNGAFSGTNNLVFNAIDRPNLSNVTDMSFMFYDANGFNQDIGDWNVSNVNNMKGMFYNATGFNQDIGAWDVSNVIDMSFMFYSAAEFNQDIGEWDVSNVVNMESMFYAASSFDQDLGLWDVSHVGSYTYVDPITFTNIGFMEYSSISISHLDDFLKAANATTAMDHVSFQGIGLSYCQGAQDLQSLIDNHYWNFIGMGLDCDYYINAVDHLTVHSGEKMVTTVTKATIDASQVTTYNIVGGADGDKFTINATTGVLSFKVAPEFSNPTDYNSDNIYRVNVHATDGTKHDVQTFKVTVVNSVDMTSIITYILF